MYIHTCSRLKRRRARRSGRRMGSSLRACTPARTVYDILCHNCTGLTMPLPKGCSNLRSVDASIPLMICCVSAKTACQMIYHDITCSSHNSILYFIILLILRYSFIVSSCYLYVIMISDSNSTSISIIIISSSSSSVCSSTITSISISVRISISIRIICMSVLLVCITHYCCY